MSRQKTIVLTGASGVVGQSIIRELGGRPVLCLVNSGTVAGPGVEMLRVDLARPRLGLDDDGYADLVARTGAIIHSGGLTDWGQSAERYQRTNVDGTREVIELARRADAPIYHQSTSFVHALADSAPLPLRETNVVTAYVRSKLAAEELLRASGVPYVIFRPTNLIGDAATGLTSRGQIVQLMSDWICRGRAKVFPAHPGNLVDIVPQDTLSRATIAAMDAGDHGREYWVTYGKEAMTVDEAVEICVAHAARRGRTVTPPRVVHPDELTPAELDALPPMSRRYVEVLADVSEVTACAGGALPSSLDELRSRYGLPHVSDRDAYRRSLEYWSEQGA
ncbi:SDR family oxidoreductase [Micromonospora echinospora]|uniref:SDR family oxidoreductase n=1 Tax=Micromonospora echinospora TaxID=1877 RepID=UPI003A86FE89